MEDISSNGNGVELSEAENELYDRQIRLWGLESQKRLRTAKVFISGLGGIGAEVTKNIILSGVHSVKLHDDKTVTEEDFCSQFLAPQSALGKNRAEASIERARALNPMVEIFADTEPLDKKDAEFFKQFDAVVVNGASNSELLRIDNCCRQYGVKFFAGDVWGTFGFFFADLQEHTFVEEVVKHKVVSKPNENLKTKIVTSIVQRELTFPPYSAIIKWDINSPIFQEKIKRTGPAFILLRILHIFRSLLNRDPYYKLREEDINKLKFIRDDVLNQSTFPDFYFEDVFSQVSPAAGIVGGVLAQEVIKVISKKGAPNFNVFLFDPQTCCGFIEAIVDMDE